MLENQNRSKLFNFALKAQNFSGMIISLVILWYVWALFFTEIDNILIARVILSALCLALAVIAPLIDFNESHATNPLWTGHARFHLVWQVIALAKEMVGFQLRIFCAFFNMDDSFANEHFNFNCPTVCMAFKFFLRPVIYARV